MRAIRPGGIAGTDDYVIDMSMFEGYPAKRGLVRPGGIAVFAVDGDRLFTRGILRDGKLQAPDSPPTQAPLPRPRAP